MKSPNPLHRLLRVRLWSFSAAIVLHLGWALALAAVLVAVRRDLALPVPQRPGTAFVPLLTLFAALCAAVSTIIWGRRQQAVRWVRSLSEDDVAVALAATSTGAVSMGLVGLVAVGIPSLSRLLSRGELDILMALAIAVIGVIAISIGWILFEGLGGMTGPLPGKLEASLSRHYPGWSTTADR
jgi:hypothetical protein